MMHEVEVRVSSDNSNEAVTEAQGHRGMVERVDHMEVRVHRVCFT